MIKIHSSLSVCMSLVFSFLLYNEEKGNRLGRCYVFGDSETKFNIFNIIQYWMSEQNGTYYSKVNSS